MRHVREHAEAAGHPALARLAQGTICFKGVDLSDPAKAAEKLEVGTRMTTKSVNKPHGDVLDFWY